MPKLSATLLTQLVVDQAPAKPNRYEMRDAYLPGLCLVIQPTGAKSWAFRYRDAAGDDVKHTLGRMTLDEAREAARKARDDLKNGVALVPLADALKTATAKAVAAKEDNAAALVPALWNRFVAEHLKMPAGKRRTPVTENTLNKFELNAERFLGVWKEKRLDKVERKDAAAIISAAKVERGPYAANNVQTVLSSFFGWALSQGIISASPLAGVKKIAENKDDRALTDDELRTVWRGCEKLHPVFTAFVRLLALTGCRRDEIAKGQWSEIDLETRVWTIPGTRTKNKKSHTIGLSPAMVAILEKLPRYAGCKFVLTTDGRRAIGGFSKMKAELDEAAPVAAWSFHDFRRTIATGLASRGVSFEVRERILNHTLKGAAAHYQDSYDFTDEKAAAWLTWSNHVTGLATGKRAKVLPYRAA